MKNRDEYNKELTKRISAIAGDKKQVKAVADELVKEKDLPIDLVVDVLTMRDNIEVLIEPIAYAFGKKFSMRMESYFNKVEIESMRNWKYKAEKLTFPLEFPMIQIADDQWVGRITVAELMKLRDVQIINYNENTQRVMKRVVKGNEEYYTIKLNRRAIASMEQLFKSGTFIPNVITLNMPEDTVFDYDEYTSMLLIRKLSHFDITDGYHRYIAMSNLYNVDKDFDYPMELRITNYSEDKSRQLIWQEDQKTKMSKVDSNSMNLNVAANKVVQKLNVDPLFNLSGSVNANGIINSAELSEIIRNTYFQASNTTSKQKEVQEIIRAEKEIRDGLNCITENNMALLEKRWNRWFLYSAIYNIYVGEAIGPHLVFETARMASKAKEMKMFVGREVKRIDMKRFAAMKKGGK